MRRGGWAEIVEMSDRELKLYDGKIIDTVKLRRWYRDVFDNNSDK